jgi:BirA family biotin operon repressor/biotin-[acetyl-CoA-carboxylase] ligase
MRTTDSLEAVDPSLDLLKIVDSTGSTNDDVVALGRASAPNGSAIAAHTQTTGRGRRGHVWESPVGSLYISVLLRPRVSTNLYMGLSVACALGVLDGLTACGATDHIALKWPNDVLAKGHKLAGILMEAVHGTEGSFAVCGVGINLIMPTGVEAASDEPLGPLAPACLADALAGRPTPNFKELAYAIHAGIISRADKWSYEIQGQTQPLAPILDEYQTHVNYLGQQVAAVSPSGKLVCQGVFSHIDGWGRAILHLDNGEDKAYSCEQISLRLI